MQINLKNYMILMRAHKPIGFFLLLWPTLIALWMAGQGHPPLKEVLLFIAGVFMMRSAGCVINDILDRKWDGFVQRTQHRPLIVGSVSLKEAIVLFCVLIFIAFILALQFNVLTIQCACAGLFLTVIYPLMKRYTYFPQFILGMAFGCSIPMAFSALTHSLPSTTWILYFANLCWVMAYDTEYACIDKEDDLAIGIKSTAIFFGSWDVFIVGVLQMLFLSLLSYLGVTLGFGFFYFLGIFSASLLVLYQQYLMRKPNPDYYSAFLNNHYLGCLLFLGLFLQTI